MKKFKCPPRHDSKFNFAKCIILCLLALPAGITKSTAQSVECGVEIPDGLNKILVEESAAIEQFAVERGAPALQDVPVRFTMLDVNTGGASVALSNLNAAFASAGLHFIQCGPINTISDDRITQNADIDQFITSFSYTSGALEVYVGGILNVQSYGVIPLQAYQSGNPNWVPGYYEHKNFVYMKSTYFNNVDFMHEVGHHYGLLHTFMPNKTYDVPYVGENTEDYPDKVLNASGQLEPWWWGRELVIRNDVQPGVKTFFLHNSGFTGDLLDDTPADCASPYPDYFPGCPLTSQSTTTCAFNSTLTYTDYNGDAINPPPAGLSLGRNYMSYWNRECLNQFTPKQEAQIGYYYETVRKPEYSLNKCDNFTDKVEFEGGNKGLHNVSIRVRHPSDIRKCNVTTDKNGAFGGILHTDNLLAYTYHNGKKNTLAYANDPLRIHYDHTHCEWLQGVSTYDLALITRHILGIQPLTSGYSIIAADASLSNSVTTFDVVELRKLILEIYDKLPVPDQPWRYIPEFIPQNYTSSFNVNPFQMTAGGGGGYLDQGWSFTLTNADDGKKGFDGIKIGDVNSSWASSSTCPNESDVPQDEGDKPTLIVPTTVLSQYEVVTLNFKVNNFQQVEAFQLGVRLPFEYFELLDVTNTPVSSYTKTDNFGLTHLEDGAVRTLWYDENGGNQTLQDNSTLFALKVKAKQSIGNLQSVLKLDNSILSNEFWRNSNVTATPVNLTVTVEAASEERNEHNEEQVQEKSLRFIPNPFNSSGRLVFEHLGQNTQGDLTISNSQGILLVRQSVSVSPGENVIEIDVLNGIQAGIYWVNLIVDGEIQSIKVVK